MSYFDSFTPYMMSLLAEQQGGIFRLAEEKNYDMNDFIMQYMNSDFCGSEMDAECSFHHFSPAGVCSYYIEEELTNIKLSEEEFCDAYWVGAIYRYLVLFSELPSKEIIKRLPPKELDDMANEYELYELEDAAKEILKKII